MDLDGASAGASNLTAFYVAPVLPLSFQVETNRPGFPLLNLFVKRKFRHVGNFFPFVL